MTYKVIPLALQGRRKNPFEAGELVTAADLPGQDLESLVKNGWLIPCEQEPEGVETGNQEIDPVVPADGIPAVDVEPADGIPAVIPEYSSITKLQLIEALMAKGVMFNPASEKKELFALLYTTSEVV
jgi:hypothetical protein